MSARAVCTASLTLARSGVVVTGDGPELVALLDVDLLVVAIGFCLPSWSTSDSSKSVWIGTPWAIAASLMVGRSGGGRSE